MRACVIGGGLSGSLLAWRLALAAGRNWTIDLFVGPAGRTDATAASGGAVRAYENDPQQRRLAIDSLAELLASRTLRAWAGFLATGSTYLRADATGLPAAVAEIDNALPGSARLASAADLEIIGWAGVPDAATAVVEESAGYLSPARLRDSVLADGALHRRVTVREVAVDNVRPLDHGTIACTGAGEAREYDLVIAATGPWTGAFLRASGLPVEGYRTKGIQYAVHPANGWRPTAFVDETTGLFGRPTADGGMLLGLPTELWDVAPDVRSDDPGLRDHAAALARERFPRLDIGPAGRACSQADCYCVPPVLTLRPIDDGLFTFTGGSGGSAKTALAASRRAAADLVDNVAEAGQPRELTPSGTRRGQP
ncbi:MAG: FAD-binding oxidoreductase [Actinomycetota bacterium]|nr:FAD-binding oxidoreductase [Actinomycetota bacterium]